MNSAPSVCYKFQPIFSYALKDFIGANSSAEEIESFFHVLEQTVDPFLDQSAARRDGVLPQFKKVAARHFAYKEVRYHNILPNMLRRCPNVKVIGVTRNPLSVISSWLAAPKEFRANLGWSELEEWRYAPKKNLNRPEEYNGFERWKDATRLFVELSQRFPSQFYLCEYRNLVHNLEAEAAAIFGFANLELGEQTRRFIDSAVSSTHEDAYSVFRANQSDEKWREHLDDIIVRSIIADLEGTPLAAFLYDAVTRPSSTGVSD